ncbi:Tel2/Rad-5/Clk-2 family protein Tel2 [Schizosaccharomyces japonicus yFS275]|uniref:Tel2/Rad-5/Clk-2 family protein Tel2 n=1 Tax=Schizosaccharomyces japonicus (strain yFS275 / FY16936) TaxID=402676 RepID=B6JXH3_SCHJY|nr:Tel2/Rad-5/Clk-2 family protein Tel2 [Schizosaccharomyces japonicus yFS275]EEB05117.2 Tel2/Rad-5/Clk-2 family protein Tel2 [Schizosaccharomyces japonicus yFS275]
MDLKKVSVKSLALELKNEVSAERLIQILQLFDAVSPVPSIDITCFLRNVLEFVFPVYWKTTSNLYLQKCLIHTVSGFLGLKTLCLTIERLCAEKNVAVEKLKLYIDVLQVAFKKFNLSQCSTRLNKLQDSMQKDELMNEVSFFFGSFRIPSAISLAITKIPQDDQYKMLYLDPKKYAILLAHHFSQLFEHSTSKNIVLWNRMFDMLVRSAHASLFVEHILPLFYSFNGKIQLFVGSLNANARYHLITLVLKLMLNQQLEDGMESDGNYPFEKLGQPIGSIATVVRLHFPPKDLIEWLELNWMNCTNLSLQRLIVLCASSLPFENDNNLRTCLLEKLLREWSTKYFINHVPLFSQKTLTIFLILLLKHSDEVVLRRIAMLFMEMKGVENRLESLDDEVRIQGMTIAELLSTHCFAADDRPLKFDVPIMNTKSALYYKALASLNDNFQNPVSKPIGLAVKETHFSEERTGKMESSATDIPFTEKQPLSTEELEPYDLPDSDTEDSTGEKVSKPVYIQKLCELLQDGDSYEKQKVALDSATELIKRKTHFGTEVVDHCIRLYKLLLGLQDSFNLPDFFTKRLKAISYLIYAAPEKCAPTACSDIFAADLSLQQRTIILSSISYAAVLLSEGDDPAIFPSKLLPQHLHTQYFTENLDLLTGDLKNLTLPEVEKTENLVSDNLKLLSTRVISHQSEIEAKKRSPKQNKMFRLLEVNTFFLLTNGFSLSMRASKSKEPLFLTSLLRTLGILYIKAATSGYPNLSQMTGEYFNVLKSCSQLGLDDSSLKEAILYGVLSIFDTTPGYLLCRDYSREVLAFRQYAELMNESIYEKEDVHAAARHILIKFEQFKEDYKTLAIENVLSASEVLSKGRFGLAGL